MMMHGLTNPQFDKLVCLGRPCKLFVKYLIEQQTPLTVFQVGYQTEDSRHLRCYAVPTVKYLSTVGRNVIFYPRDQEVLRQ
jgi:hypothetical protein